MNNSSLASLPDSFSWRRVFQFGRLYSRPIKIQILVALVLGLGFGALNVLAFDSPHLFKATYYLYSMVMCLLICTSPIVFAQSDETVAYLEPASTKEKLTFYVLYSAVIFPCILYLLTGLYTLAGAWITHSSDFRVFLINALTGSNPYTGETAEVVTRMPMFLSSASNRVSNIPVILISLCATLLARRRKMVYCILFPLLALMLIGFLSGILVAIYAFINGGPGIFGIPELYASMRWIAWVALVFNLALGICIVAWLYHKLKRRNII